MKHLFSKTIAHCEINLGIIRFGYKGKKIYW